MSDDSSARRAGWTLISRLSGVGGAILARKVLRWLWPGRLSAGQEPPLNPADRRIGWVPALQWAVAAGVGAGLARLVSQRLAAAGWEAATGDPPPGVRAA